MPESEKAHTKRKRDNASQNIDIEVYEDEACLPATDVHLDTSVKSLHDEPDTSDGRIGVSFEEVANDNNQPSLPEYEEKFTQSSQIEEIVEPMVSHYIYFSSLDFFLILRLHVLHIVMTNAYLGQDAMDAGPSYNSEGENDRSNCTLSRNLVAPTVVHVSRPKEVEEQRMGLPIVMMEQEIMEAINENISLIICGETGCGKTTQVPQVS